MGGIPEDRFSRVAAQMILLLEICLMEELGENLKTMPLGYKAFFMLNSA